MVKTDTLEFPREETEARIEFMKEFLPGVGRRLVSLQATRNIAGSPSGREDYELMKGIEREVEKDLLEAMEDYFPGDGVESEEAGERGGDGEFRWLFDPVDGSRNFIHGVPLFCISAGLYFRDEPVGGVVHVPVLMETYRAIRGLGAYKNDLPIEVSGVNDLERSLITNGLPFRRLEILSEIVADISAFITTGIGLRRTGSSVLDLCWIAEGRIDAMWERDISPYDLSAASVILREAGGIISGFQGESFSPDLNRIVASNGVIHPRVLEVLKKVRHVEGVN